MKRFDKEKFGRDVRTKRLKDDISFRSLTKFLGISVSTLQKCEEGKLMAGAESFMNICEWLKKNPEHYMNSETVAKKKGFVKRTRTEKEKVETV